MLSCSSTYCISQTLITPLHPFRRTLVCAPSKFMPLWYCSTTTEGWSAIQGREETGTEAFWWCNWQQMRRKMEIKEKEFKIISVWACIRGVIMSTEGSCFDFCLTDSLLLKCFHFTVVWAMEIWHFSATAVAILWRKIVATVNGSNKTKAIPTWSERLTGPVQKTNWIC